MSRGELKFRLGIVALSIFGALYAAAPTWIYFNLNEEQTKTIQQARGLHALQCVSHDLGGKRKVHNCFACVMDAPKI